MVGHEILIDEKVRTFLSEDLGFGDITTDSIIDEDVQVEARVVCKERAVIAGLKEASKVFTILGCTVKLLVKDGSIVKSGTPVLQVNGFCGAILKGERTALNILMRMSGIATVTESVLSKARKVNPSVRIACTRKTAPGLRYFDKKAVEVGGGDTHRLRLDDCILIKDNHLRIAGSVKDAVKKVKEKVSFTKKIEVEVENIDQAIEAAEAEVDIIMLDNMTTQEILVARQEFEKKDRHKRVLVEASGGINQKNVIEYAKTGVDIISMGSLTHSVKSINLNLEIVT
jgi:nicotinate-nucleotide pyrophosphorylase (carboxylating)